MHVLQDTARTYLQFDGAFVWKRDSDIIQSRHFPQHISVYPYQWNDCGGGWGGAWHLTPTLSPCHAKGDHVVTTLSN